MVDQVLVKRYGLLLGRVLLTLFCLFRQVIIRVINLARKFKQKVILPGLLGLVWELSG